MKIYIANFADQASFEADCDDPPKPYEIGLEGYASPQFSHVSLALTDAWIEELKAAAIDEVAYLEGEEVQAGWDESMTWETEGMIVPEQGRPYQQFRLVDVDDTIVSLIIVQEVEVA